MLGQQLIHKVNLDDKLEHVTLVDSDDDFAELELPELQRRNRSHAKDTPRCAIETCHPQITEDQHSP